LKTVYLQSGNEVTDDTLGKAFSKYSSFAKAKVVRDARTKKTKGFGFVSFLDSADFARALKEMQGKYIGNRPCKLSKSSWDEREVHVKGNKSKGNAPNKKQKP
jgi:RNA recognition motif-containing protein